ncbi:Pkinase-domain-containing protein, partial [Aphelenchoides avenae]
NVIPIYEFFEDYYKKVPRTFYMVMELGSESLTSVKDNNRLTDAQCAFIFAKVASALKHVHSLGVVHRDLKPDNVMICFDGTPKLVDFGESARLQDDGACTGDRGSPMYMAPEMVTTTYGPKVDVFSLGISAAEVTQQGMYILIRSNEANTHKAIRARVSRMPETYQELVLACVAFDPSKRPSSSEVFDTLVNGLAQGLDASCMQNIVENFIH